MEEVITKDLELNEEVEQSLLYLHYRKKELKAEIKELDSQLDEFKGGIKEAMNSAGLTTLKTENGVSITNKQEGVREVFDKKKLKELYPEICDECTHIEFTEPSLTIRVTAKEG